MGQLSAELNYERRMERYEKEVEDHILNNENWEEELEHYLEKAIEEVEEQREEEGTEGKANEEYEDHSAILVAANLTEGEKREGEEGERGKGEHEVVGSDGLVLLQKPEGKESLTESISPASEAEDLRDLIEGIEALVEGHPEKVEKTENLTEEDVDKELSREEERQEELGKEELFEALTKTIEGESEEPLERLFEKFEESGEAEKPIGELEYGEFEEYRKPEKEFVEHGGSKEEFEEPIEKNEEYEEELGLLEKFEEFEEGLEDEGRVGEATGKAEEKEEAVEEPESAEGIREEVEETAEKIEEKEEVIEEPGGEAAREAGENASEGVEEVGIGGEVEEVEEEGGEEDVEEEAQEQGAEGEGEGGDGGGPQEAVAAGEEEPEKEFELKDFEAGEEKLSLRGKKLEHGFHWAHAVRDDGEVVEWAINVKREAGKIRVPKDLKSRRVKELTIYRYDRNRHFPRFFKVLRHSLHFDPVAKRLMLDGREIGVEKIQWELEKFSKRKEHGPYLTVTTSLKSIKAHGGHQLQLRLYQDGTVNIKDPSGQTRSIRELEVDGNLLRLKYYRFEPVFPLYTQKLEDRVKYDIGVNVKGKTTICFVEKLREKFGRDNVEEMRERIAKGEAALVAYFDKGKSCCRNKELVITVPMGSEILERIEVLPTKTLIEQKAADLLSNYNKVDEGNIGEFLIKDKYEKVILEEVSKLLGVSEQELKMERPERRGPDYLIKNEKTGEVFVILDAKSTIRLNEFDNLNFNRVIKQLTGYMEEEEYKSARFVLVARDYYDPWEVLETGGGIKRFKLIKMSRDGRMKTIFEDEEGG